MSIRKRRDVIESPINGQLDINGWDLQKALLLLRKSNSPLLEWLGSPIIYLEEYTVAAQMRTLATKYYSGNASAYYLHMAQRNYLEYLRGERVWLKKYFYVLRPILAMKWIEQGKGMVPTEFDVLVDRVVTHDRLKHEIVTLTEAKRKGEELDYGPRIPPSGDFLERELDHFNKYKVDMQKHTVPIETLDKVFLSALKQVWNFKPPDTI